MLETNCYSPILNKEHKCWFLQQNSQLHLQLCSKSFTLKHNNHKNVEGKMKKERREKKICLQSSGAWLGFCDGGSLAAIMFRH